MEAFLLLINPDGSQAVDNSWTYVLLATVLLPLALVWLAFPFIVWRKLNQLIELTRGKEWS
jgi:hypothetical protein